MISFEYLDAALGYGMVAALTVILFGTIVNLAVQPLLIVRKIEEE